MKTKSLREKIYRLIPHTENCDEQEFGNPCICKRQKRVYQILELIEPKGEKDWKCICPTNYRHSHSKRHDCSQCEDIELMNVSVEQPTDLKGLAKELRKAQKEGLWEDRAYPEAPWKPSTDPKMYFCINCPHADERGEWEGHEKKPEPTNECKKPDPAWVECSNCGEKLYLNHSCQPSQKEICQKRVEELGRIACDEPSPDKKCGCGDWGENKVCLKHYGQHAGNLNAPDKPSDWEEDWQQEFDKVFNLIAVNDVRFQLLWTYGNPIKRKIHDTIKDYIAKLLSERESQVKREGWENGARKALELISACYSPQSKNYQQSVQDDVKAIKKAMGLEEIKKE